MSFRIHFHSRLIQRNFLLRLFETNCNKINQVVSKYIWILLHKNQIKNKSINESVIFHEIKLGKFKKLMIDSCNFG